MSKRNKRLASVRCKATNRWGERCKAWAMKGAVVCNKHGGAAPQVRKKAQERIMMAQDDAASLLVKFMSSDKVPYAERRRAAEFLLTYENRNKVEVTLAKWEEDLGELLLTYEPAESADDIVDAELVDEHAFPPSDWESRKELSLAEEPPRYNRGGRLRGQ